MKYVKAVLLEEVKHELDWIRQDRDVRWINRHVAYLVKLNKKKRWPWSKVINPPSLKEYKQNFTKYTEDLFDWSPEEVHQKYEAGLRAFIDHCRSDKDPEFVYLNSTDINYYCLNKILRRLV